MRCRSTAINLEVVGADIHPMRRRALTQRVRALLVVGALVVSLLTTLTATSTPASALTTVSQVSAGGRTTCAVMTGGNAYCWGDNSFGQLGNGTTTNSPTPVLVSGGYTWASISTQYDENDGAASTCGVTVGGTGYCWGYNGWGELGNGTTTQATTPVLVSGSHTWASISVGYQDACGITTGGAGYCWGFNTDGEVGDNTTTQDTTPTAISGAYTWSTIKEGFDDTCGVTTAGTGYCWGWNQWGELGNGGTVNAHVPTAVSGGYTWSAISAGSNNTCGFTTSGVGYCWGKNTQGEGGNNTTSEQDSPTAILGGYTWQSMSQGHYETCGITTSQVSYCWGQNSTGSVGDGTTTERDVPTAVSGGRTFTSISVGASWNVDDTTCGLAQDGILYCWGYNNSSSQIGDGTTTSRSVPTEATLLFASTDNTTLSVTIIPSFTFTIGNRASACNGESNFASGAGTASTITLGNLAAGANVSGGQALTVAGNSGGGFAVYVAGNQATNDLRGGGHNWADVSGAYASPAVLGAGEQFGYTYHDSTASSSVVNPASATFIALTNANEPVMGSTSSVSGNGCISFDAQTSASTPAASYSATVIYTAVPTF